MAKGKTNQPLAFAIPMGWAEKPLFRDLAEKGHTVVEVYNEEFDIVFGPNCHMLTEDMMNQKGMVDVALRAARKRKKGK